jgi:multiple sugar transport system substrate-binding protein/sn-glycerol 3-phosphate transport system substrate-binding protein
MHRKHRFFLTSILLGLTLVGLAGCNQVDPDILDATILAPHAEKSATPTGINQSITPVAEATIPPSSVSMPQASSASPEPSGTPKVGLDIDPARLAGLTVQFWHPWSGATGEIVNELIKEFNKSNEWGIQVDMNALGSLENLTSEISAALQTGFMPGMVVTYPYQALEWDEQKPLVDLNTYLFDDRYGLTPDEQGDLIPAFWGATEPDGKRLTAPALGSGQALYYNQSWAKELGFSNPPTTPEQLEQQACLAAQANNQDENKDNDGTGGLVLSTHYSAMLGWMRGFGGDIYAPSQAAAKQSPYHFGSKQVENAFTFLRKLYDKGCAWLPEEPYPEEAFANRGGLLAVNSLTSIPYQEQVFKQSGNADQWTVIPFPTPEGQPAIDVYSPSFAIFTATPDQQLAAWLLARWLLDTQNQARLAQAASGFPVRASAVQVIQTSPGVSPQLVAAQELLEYAQAEPATRSWKTVRWAVSDAATQLFRSYFSVDQTPGLVQFLNKTAEELNRTLP